MMQKRYPGFLQKVFKIFAGVSTALCIKIMDQLANVGLVFGKKRSFLFMTLFHACLLLFPAVCNASDGEFIIG